MRHGSFLAKYRGLAVKTHVGYDVPWSRAYVDVNGVDKLLRWYHVMGNVNIQYTTTYLVLVLLRQIDLGQLLLQSVLLSFDILQILQMQVKQFHNLLNRVFFIFTGTFVVL